MARVAAQWTQRLVVVSEAMEGTGNDLSVVTFREARFVVCQPWELNHRRPNVFVPRDECRMAPKPGAKAMALVDAMFDLARQAPPATLVAIPPQVNNTSPGSSERASPSPARPKRGYRREVKIAALDVCLAEIGHFSERWVALALRILGYSSERSSRSLRRGPWPVARVGRSDRIDPQRRAVDAELYGEGSRRHRAARMLLDGGDDPVLLWPVGEQ